MSEWAAVGQTAVDSDVRYVATCGAAQLETGSHLWTGKDPMEGGTRDQAWVANGGRSEQGPWRGDGMDQGQGWSEGFLTSGGPCLSESWLFPREPSCRPCPCPLPIG